MNIFPIISNSFSLRPDWLIDCSSVHFLSGPIEICSLILQWSNSWPTKQTVVTKNNTSHCNLRLQPALTFSVEFLGQRRLRVDELEKVWGAKSSAANYKEK